MSTATHSTLMDHVHELRGRLSWSVGVFILGAVGGYLARDAIITFLQEPLHQKLYYTTPTGAFEFIVQICGLVGLIIALPVIIYHLLRFVEPALPKPLSWRILSIVILASLTLALSGAAFAYYVSLPAALHFFNSVGSSDIHALISVDTYFKFVFTYLATFAIVFQLPLILLLADHFTPLGPKGMGKWRKWVILGAFAVALVTPSAPDPLSQIILALPIIALFEVSLGLISIKSWVRRSGQAEARALPQTVRTTSPTPTMSSDAPPVRRPIRDRTSIGPIDLRNSYHPRRQPPTNVLDLRQISHS